MAIRRKRYCTHPTSILAMIPICGYSQPFQEFSHCHCYRAQMLYWCCEVCRKLLTKSTDWRHLSEILQPDLATTADPDWEGCHLGSNFTYFTWANILQPAKIIIFYLCLTDFTAVSHLAVSDKQV